MRWSGTPRPRIGRAVQVKKGGRQVAGRLIDTVIISLSLYRYNMRRFFVGSGVFSGRNGIVGAVLLASAAAVPLLATPAAHAFSGCTTPACTTVNVNGQDWEIRLTYGSWGSAGVINGIDLQTQPWFGDNLLTQTFLYQVGSDLGTPNGGGPPQAGPFFAYALDTFNEPFVLFLRGTSMNLWQPGATDPFYYAYATPVPAPVPFLGAAAAFGYSRKLRKRIQSSKVRDAGGLD